MATYMDVNRVKYETSSGVKAPLYHLYFCRFCLKLRSNECVAHEVDSLYCPHCLESMHINEAASKKYRCGQCFDCPSCSHTLATRATTIPMPDRDQPGKTVPKKVYYLACGFCRWTSRDVGMSDQLVANGGWKDQPNKHEKRIGTLMEYFRQLAQKEKAEKEKKRYIRRRSYLHLSKNDGTAADKFGLSPSAAARRRSGLSSAMGGVSLKDDDTRIMEIDGSVATDDVDDLPDDIYTKPLQLTEVTNIQQRLANPEQQPETMSKLFPRHKHVLTKCSQRCRECEHNLSKPEFNPCSIKFKIQLVAHQNVPEIRLMRLPALKLDKENPVTLTLTNPLDTMTRVTLLPDDREDWSNAKLVLPKCELVLPPRDDATEFEENPDQHHNFDDDPSVMVFRKATKIGFLIHVTPLKKEEDVKISFYLKYDYNLAGIMSPPGEKKDDIVWLEHRLLLNLGPINS